MERLAELISKLKEQFDSGADSSKLLGITLLIERELMKEENAQAPAFTSSKISVVMPVARNGFTVSGSAEAAKSAVSGQQQPAEAGKTSHQPLRPPRQPLEEVYQTADTEEIPVTTKPSVQESINKLVSQPANPAGGPPASVTSRSTAAQPQTAQAAQPINPAQKAQPLQPQPSQAAPASPRPAPAPPRPTPAKAQPQPLHEPEEPAKKDEYAPEFNFDPLTEIPTLSQQHTVQEINEMIGIRDASLNDKLKEHKVEIGQLLNDHPIKDLKKAININDRYVFINDLFRGDEVMYERSLKTINAFRIYAEAEYWIERELKVKLGWLENHEVTRHFYQLVKRRFT